MVWGERVRVDVIRLVEMLSQYEEHDRLYVHNGEEYFEIKRVVPDIDGVRIEVE